jgi:nicotinamidase-related amidase
VASRQAGIEVVYVTLGELTKDSRDAGRRQRVRGFLFPAGAPEARVLDELAPESGELVIRRSCSGAFNCTNLDWILRNMGIDTIIIVGTVTHGCVELTARVASDIGYGVVVVSDACATLTEDLHRNALERMNDGCIYVKTTRETLQRLESLCVAPR